MAATLGDRYDSVMFQIEKAENSASYQTSSGDQLVRANLSQLYKERDRILAMIEKFGRNYTEGQSSSNYGDTALVSFS